MKAEIQNPVSILDVYTCILHDTIFKSELTCDLIAYAQIVVQVAQRHGGLGWITYDQIFCQQMAGGTAVPWRR